MIQIIVGEFVDEQGRRIIKTQWAEPRSDVDLGSKKKPATYKGYKILSFRYDVPESEKQDDVFSAVFKKFIKTDDD